MASKVLVGENHEQNVENVVFSKSGLRTVLVVLKIQNHLWANLGPIFSDLQSQRESYAFRKEAIMFDSLTLAITTLSLCHILDLRKLKEKSSPTCFVYLPCPFINQLPFSQIQSEVQLIIASSTSHLALIFLVQFITNEKVCETEKCTTVS